MSKQQLLQDLIGAKALIDSPEKWIQNDLARTADGLKCCATQKEAACFCSMGAWVNYLGEQATDGAREGAIAHALYAAAQRVSGDADDNIVRYNDSHSHAEVMAVWDDAIAAANVAAQVENLETLLAAVEAQPEQNFNLSYFREDDNVCGTLFCTVGLACTMPVFQRQGFELIEKKLECFTGRSVYYVEVNGQDVRDTGAADTSFGADAYNELFSTAGDSNIDELVGYKSIWKDDTEEYVTNMTHKELAVARLKYRIAQLKEQA